jgi:cyclohexyl-isocyanide hydratase
MQHFLGLHGRSAVRRRGSIEGLTGDDPLGIFSPATFFGTEPVAERVVVDGSYVFAAGVTAGIDGALRRCTGNQLYMKYAPEPAFESGTPATAPREIVRDGAENRSGHHKPT